jgi:hypothetical protein
MRSLVYLKGKAIGWLLYLPLLLLITMLVLVISVSDSQVNAVVIVLQLSFVTLSILWAIYLFYDLFGTGNFSYLWLYYRVRFGRMILLYLTILSVPLLLIMLIMEMKFQSQLNFVATFFFIISQSILGGVFTLFILAVLGDVDWVITLFFLYISVELTTFGKNDYLYSLFYLNLEHGVGYTTLLNLGTVHFLFGLITYKSLKMLLD